MGPLEGMKVVEIASIGPGPMCAMLLADMGATVLRVDRASAVGIKPPTPHKFATLHRGRQSIAVDLKNPDGVKTVLELVEGLVLALSGRQLVQPPPLASVLVEEGLRPLIVAVQPWFR